MKMRFDELLVKNNLASTRSRAKQLIVDGKAMVNGSLHKKPGQLFNTDSTITITQEEHYVSRGALKLERAIKAFKINPKGLIVADVGASTGGFTDYLLKNGASKVYAIDVGHDQLAESLRQSKEVVNMEGVNIRYPLDLKEKVDLAVVDLSYISLRLTLANIASLLKPNCPIIALIKPQFEAGPKAVGKDGVIKNPQILEATIENLKQWCGENQLPIEKIIPSPIQGKEGNHEFLALIVPLFSPPSPQ